MSLADREELALLAGIFWGEGCVMVNQQRPETYVLRVSVTNTDRELLERFRRRFGGAVNDNGGRDRPGYERAWKWAVFGERACDVLDEIAPFLGGIKREAAELGRTWRTLLHGSSKGPVPPDTNSRRLAIHLALKRINNPNGTRGTRKAGV